MYFIESRNNNFIIWPQLRDCCLENYKNFTLIAILGITRYSLENSNLSAVLRNATHILLFRIAVFRITSHTLPSWLQSRERTIIWLHSDCNPVNYNKCGIAILRLTTHPLPVRNYNINDNFTAAVHYHNLLLDIFTVANLRMTAFYYYLISWCLQSWFALSLSSH